MSYWCFQKQKKKQNVYGKTSIYGVCRKKNDWLLAHFIVKWVLCRVQNPMLNDLCWQRFSKVVITKNHLIQYRHCLRNMSCYILIESINRSALSNFRGHITPDLILCVAGCLCRILTKKALWDLNLVKVLPF